MMRGLSEEGTITQLYFCRVRNADSGPLSPMTPGDAKELLTFGLAMLGMKADGSQITNIRRFQAHYGIHAEGLFKLLVDLKEENDPKVDFTYFMMTFNWLKLYETEHCMHSRWGFVEQTIREKVRLYVQMIKALKNRVIVWGDFGDDTEVYIMSIDGVHCRIWEPRKDPGSKHYSHKHNGAGVAYEIGISLRRRDGPGDFCIWIRGPFEASTHDLTMFRGGKKGKEGEWDEEALLRAIPDGKQAIADSAFIGEAGLGGKISVSRETDSKELQAFKARVKARHETFNKHLKDFNVLDLAYRHQSLKHEDVFTAVCVAVQYDLLNGHPLFDV